jgi:hypothetical protein
MLMTITNGPLKSEARQANRAVVSFLLTNIIFW